MPESTIPARVPASLPATRTAPDGTIMPRLEPRRSSRTMAVAIGLVVLPLVLDLPPQRPEWLALGVALAAVAVLVMLIEFMEGRQRVTRLVPAVFFLLAIAALRHSAGGAESGYSSLVLLAILMLGYLGSRRELMIGLVVMVLVLAVPILLAGAPDYPFGEWRRVLFTSTVGAFIGFGLRRLVVNLSVEAEVTREQGDALARQVEVTNAILDTATDSIVSFDDEGRVTAANAAAEVLLGRSAEALVGQAMLPDLVVAGDRERLQAGLGRWRVASPPERERRFETELVRPDGTHVPIEVTIATTNGPDGPRFHAFCRDISERRAVERADHEHLDDLKRLAAARDLAQRGIDGRAAICAAAVDLARADMALFIERPQGALEATGTVGTGDVVDRVEVADHSISALVFETSTPVFVGDLMADPRSDQETALKLGIRAAYWQPIVTDGRTVAVLVVSWHEVRESISDRSASLLGLFAAQTAALVERADLLARLETLARTDPLTGAANRRALDEGLTRTLAAASRTHRPVSIVMLDLDHFKLYNDARGHQAGDGHLQNVVLSWRRQLRPSDELARYGGEEFLVTLPDCDLETAGSIADRLRSAVPDGQTTSAGVAGWDGSETLTALIARADVALYAAKAAGRDRTVLAAAPLLLGSLGG
jgi:diguanylate cyclase (GGDEF)-like protein/PAS domain S-box-containing protein